MEDRQKSEKECKGAEKIGKKEDLVSTVSCGLKKYAPYILLVLGLLLLYNIFQLTSIRSHINDAVLAEKEAAIPLDMTLTLITLGDCEECTDLTSLVNAVKALNVNIIEETKVLSTSDEGKEIIEEYKIQTLPAIILGFDPAMAMKIKPEILTELEVLGFVNADDPTDYYPPEPGYIFQATTPPYYDVAAEGVKGLVTVTLLTTPDCEDCREIQSMVTALEKVLTIQEFNEVAYDSEEAMGLIEQYTLLFVPTLFLSKDASAYEGFADLWLNYGTVEDDGTFVLRSSIPPYLNTTTEDVEGIVDVTYLTDESCATCYNVSIHKAILEGFGVVFGEEETVDRNSDEGKALLQEYDITKVPTIILSPDVASYATVKQIWNTVGVIADDGSYIFTNMAQLQGANYTDLSATP